QRLLNCRWPFVAGSPSAVRCLAAHSQDRARVFAATVSDREALRQLPAPHLALQSEPGALLAALLPPPGPSEPGMQRAARDLPASTRKLKRIAAPSGRQSAWPLRWRTTTNTGQRQ